MEPPSPELTAAQEAARAWVAVADELKAAHARAEAEGTLLYLDEYGPLQTRLAAAEANYWATVERMLQSKR